jgi:N-acetylglutamate synthase-like GNAT family acetyltransferase
MLPRSPEPVALALDDFTVAADGRGRVLGCGALREYSPSLAEISSLAVAPQAHGGGIGTAVVRALEQLARLRGVRELFALTLAPAFFEGLGYIAVDRTQYPEKMRRDCASCARRVPRDLGSPTPAGRAARRARAGASSASFWCTPSRARRATASSGAPLTRFARRVTLARQSIARGDLPPIAATLKKC